VGGTIAAEEDSGRVKRPNGRGKMGRKKRPEKRRLFSPTEKGKKANKGDAGNGGVAEDLRDEFRIEQGSYVI